MEIKLNGQALIVTEGIGLRELLRQQGVNPDARGYAVAVNAKLVRRTIWGDTYLQPGDAVEIVHARQGG